ncbi:GspE/PulE family protein [Marinobacter sp. MBR-105]
MSIDQNPNRRTIGSILLEKGWIKQSVLEQAIKVQEKQRSAGKSVPKLGDILVYNNVITSEQLRQALQIQKNAQYSANHQITTRIELEERYGTLTRQNTNRLKQSDFVSGAASKHMMVAEDRSGNPLILISAAAKSAHVNAFTQLNKDVREAYADSGEEGKSSRPTIVHVSEDIISLFSETDASDQTKEEDQTAFEKEFDELLKKAYESKAVDVHFFRGHDNCRVRFRIYGALRDHTEWKIDKADRIISVGFSSRGVGGKEAYWQKTVMQRRRLKVDYNHHVKLDCRYEHAPGDDGAYHACIRILANDKREVKELIDLEKLGFTRAQTRLLQAGASKASGLVILSGPTGSGKSTTLAAIIKWLNRNDDVNILTVESPIERELPAFQTSVSDNSENPQEFAEAIKSTLRRDPDILMVGEIRDKYSAQAAVSGVQTGHTLLTTVHAQSGIEIVERLASPVLQVPAQTIGSPSLINALVFQMLLPKLDDKSKIRLTPENMYDHLDRDLVNRLSHVCPDITKANICVRGQSTEYPEGVSGMTICAEVIAPDLVMRKHFAKLELTEALMHWRKSGQTEKAAKKDYNERVVGFTALDHAIAKMLRGEIDPRDVENYFGMLNMQDILKDGIMDEDEMPELFTESKGTEDDDDGFVAENSGEIPSIPILN